jgi:hypothetical protein
VNRGAQNLIFFHAFILIFFVGVFLTFEMTRDQSIPHTPTMQCVMQCGGLLFFPFSTVFSTGLWTERKKRVSHVMAGWPDW